MARNWGNIESNFQAWGRQYQTNSGDVLGHAWRVVSGAKEDVPRSFLTVETNGMDRVTVEVPSELVHEVAAEAAKNPITTLVRIDNTNPYC